jgi:hypothetical protein
MTACSIGNVQPILEDERIEGWRRGGESNPRVKVLQTSALPLGYRADRGASFFDSVPAPECQYFGRAALW